VDESYVGGLEEGARGRGTEKKAVVAIAAEEDGKGIGRVRMRRIEDCSAKELHVFVRDAVEPGSRVHTDGWGGYTGLKKKGTRSRPGRPLMSGRRGADT
jgi:transposase-like protein